VSNAAQQALAADEGRRSPCGLAVALAAEARYVSQTEVMSTLAEIEQQLPNGFHDAEIRSCTLDFMSRTVSFVLDVWIGDMASSDESQRERYRAGTLAIAGVAFCQIEAPDPTYPFREAKPLRVDLCKPEPSPIGSAASAASFQARFYVSNWNSFINLAADDAKLEWTDDATLSRAG
jgi:hypothetical protein